MEMYSGTATFEDWQFLINIKRTPHYVKTIQGIHPKEIKVLVTKRDIKKCM